MDILDTVFIQEYNTFGVLLTDKTIKVFVQPESIIDKTGDFYININQVTEKYINGDIDMNIWIKSQKLFKILEEYFDDRHGKPGIKGH